MPDDHESKADSQRHDKEEERRRKRTGEEEGEVPPSSPDRDRDDSFDQDEEEATADIEPDYTPSKLTIPSVTLEERSATESIDPRTSAPRIERTTREIIVPELSPSPTSVNTTPIDVKAEVPEIASERNDWKIPIVQLGSPSSVQFSPLSFDTEVREPTSQPQKQLTIPLYRRVSPPRLRFASSLDETLSEEIRRRLEQLESPEINTIDKPETGVQKNETIDNTVDETGQPTGGSTVEPANGDQNGDTDEEVPTFQDLIYGSGAPTTTTEGTTIVLFNEADDNSYVGSYVTLCRRIYREANGGHPDVQPINELDEINKREIEKWLDADMKVILIDLDDRERRIDEAKLREKLEATLGKFGFIVFKATDQDVIREYRNTLQRIDTESPFPSLKLVEVTPVQPGFDTECRMTELCWGNLNLPVGGFKHNKPDIERPTGTAVFDDLFNKYAPEQFNDYLEKIGFGESLDCAPTNRQN